MSPPTWQYCDVTTSTGEYSCLQVGVFDKQTNADPFPFVVRSTTCLVHAIIVMDPHNDDIINAMFVRLTCSFPGSCPSTSSRSTFPQWWSWLSPGSRSGLTTSRWGTQRMRCRLHDIHCTGPGPGEPLRDHPPGHQHHHGKHPVLTAASGLHQGLSKQGILTPSYFFFSGCGCLDRNVCLLRILLTFRIRFCELRSEVRS